MPIIAAAHYRAMQGAPVTADTDIDQAEHAEKYSPELLEAIPNRAIFAYNLNEKNTPGGTKVRWKIRVATGPEAQRAEARQSEAIKEALTWWRKQQARTGQT